MRFQQRLQRIKDECSMIDPVYVNKWNDVRTRGKIFKKWS